MAKKPRKFERKIRGDKKFVKENELLMLNVAKENGLAVWCDYSKSYVIDKITPELIALTKEKIVKINLLKKDNNSIKQDKWGQLVFEIQKYDRVNGSNVWGAFQVWLDNNHQVKSMRGNKRLGVCSTVLIKMIKCMDIKLGLTPTQLHIKLAKIAKDYQEYLDANKDNQPSEFWG